MPSSTKRRSIYWPPSQSLCLNLFIYMQKLNTLYFSWVVPKLIYWQKYCVPQFPSPLFHYHPLVFSILAFFTSITPTVPISFMFTSVPFLFHYIVIVSFFLLTAAIFSSFSVFWNFSSFIILPVPKRVIIISSTVSQMLP